MSPKLKVYNSGSVDGSSGPPHDGGMDDVIRRVDVLEGDVKEVKADLKVLVKEVSAIRERMAGIEGRLSNLPTAFQMQSWFVAVALGLVGLVFTIAKVMGGH